MDRDSFIRRIASLSPAKRAFLELKLENKSTAASPEQTIPRLGTHDSVPLSFAQQRLWFLNQLGLESPSYNQPKAIRLSGLLDVKALQKALDQIVSRHEVLRTTFVPVDGVPVQVIADRRHAELPVLDLRTLPEAAREAEVDRVLVETIRHPFDLSRDLMLRALLLRLDDQEHILLLVTHHIASDGWSAGILWQELAALYRAFASGHPSPLPELPIQYADYALWQRQSLQGAVLEAQLSYWKKQLDSISTLQLPTDRPRPPVQTFRGATQSLMLTKGLSEALNALSRKEGVTLFITLLAAFQTLLYRYTGKDDIVVGSPIAGRTRRELEGLIGFFVNTLVLRTDLSGNPSFRELLGRVRKVAWGAYAHQDLPFEKLVEELKPERNLSNSPLFQVMFALQNVPRQAVELPGLTLRPMDADSGTAKFDLTLSMRERTEGLRQSLTYNTDLFDDATITRMLSHFQTLLKSIAADADQRLSDLPFLTDAERHQLLVERKNTDRDYPRDKCIHQLFEAQVERTPDAVAVIFEDGQLTYRELNIRANQLAHYLQKLGVGPEVLVGLCVERSLEMVVGLLGILKAGGAYVSLDPAYPKDRLAYILSETQIGLVLTKESLLKNFPAFKGQVLFLDRDRTRSEQQEHNPKVAIEPDNLAYVVYTSGSTGKPKGVLSCHRGVVNYLSYLSQTYNLNGADTVLQIPSLSFDASVRDLIGPLTAGAQVVIVNDFDAKEPAALLLRIKERGVTCILSIVPTLLNGLLEAGGNRDLRYESIRLILVSGEALTTATCRNVKKVFGQGALVVNQYGPTECTMTSSYHPVSEADDKRGIAPLGKPIPNAWMYILDSHRNLIPIGIPGEVYIGGVGLARGYMNAADLTAERFVLDPFSGEPGARLYKTGDLARYVADGNIEFLGRIDHQVKIRGFRIELGEIEVVLAQHPAVQQAVAVVREDAPGDNRLVAYIVPSIEQRPTINDLRNFLKSKLPEYMVPSAFVVLDALPLTPNRKVDRQALPAPDQDRPDLQGAFVAPRTPTEKVITGIWAEVLKVERVGIHDNFFDLGGHSLLVVKLIAKIKQELRVDLPLSDLFEFPTVTQLAERVEAKQDEGCYPREGTTYSHVLELQRARNGKRVFCVPHRGGFRDEFYNFTKLARLIGPDYSFYGLRARGTDGVSSPHHHLEDIAAHYIKQIQTIQSHGPYFLLGECFGGRVTYETARQLRVKGEKVALLAFLDASAGPHSLKRYLPRRLLGVRARYHHGLYPSVWKFIKSRIAFHLRQIQNITPGERLHYLLDKTNKARTVVSRVVVRDNLPLRKRGDGDSEEVRPQNSKQLERAETAYYLAAARHRPRSYDGKIVLIANEQRRKSDPTFGWGKLALGGVEVHQIPGNHNTYITENIHVVAKVLKECLEKAEIGLN